ncbi:MAG: hypothetical protein ABIU54_01190 [Candidatus Eisenbacteria bacterium]
MTRNVGNLIAPLAAIALFALVLLQTWTSLRAAGAWHARKPAVAIAADDPFLMLDQQLGRAFRPMAATIRDPFRFGGVSAPVAIKTATKLPRLEVPAPPARPVLTAIVWDNDPRAIVNWKGRAWTIHEGLLFDEFVVTSIRPEQVVLKRGDESIVLTRKSSGE